MRSVVAIALALAVVGATDAHAHAPAVHESVDASEPPPPAGPVADPPHASEDPALVRARELYRQGEARFATADYFAAIELWTQAFQMVPDTADAARIQAALIYDIATAREKAFEVSGDLTHLKQAKVLMEDYRATIPQLYGDGPEAEEERARITGRLNGIARQIAKVERDRERQHGRSGPVDRAPAGDPKRARALVASGATLLGLGVGAFAMMTAGLVVGTRANDISELEKTNIEKRREQFHRGVVGNRLSIAGGVVGGVFVVVGAALLGVGLKERRRALAIAPHLQRGYAGLSLSARF